MNRTFSLDDVGGRLGELVASLAPGDEVVLTRDQHPVAKLVPIAEGERAVRPCEPGSAKDTQHWMSPDFNDSLDEFGE
jgi:antitoxin (DNA-binding transcriptional repressor) of toxin-antitoxin stability system